MYHCIFLGRDHISSNWQESLHYARGLVLGRGGLLLQRFFIRFIPYWYRCAKVKGFEFLFEGIIHFFYYLVTVRTLQDLCFAWFIRVALFVYICTVVPRSYATPS